MNYDREEIQRIMEALGKGGIHVQGDFVVSKYVEYEVNNVESGGIVQVNPRDDRTARAADEATGEISADELARAIENCQQYFWGNSAYAVLYCLFRDVLKRDMSQTGFERMVGVLPYTRRLDYECTIGTVANALKNNAFMRRDVAEWEMVGAPQRALLLLGKLREEMKI